MKKYRLNVVSQTNIIILIILLLLPFFAITLNFGIPKHRGIFTPIIIIFFVLAIFLWRRFVTGIIEWTFDGNGIEVRWIKSFFLSDQKNRIMQWKEIDKLSIGWDPHYYTFIIKLNSGEEIKFCHDSGFFKKDDFKEFDKAFQRNSWFQS